MINLSPTFETNLVLSVLVSTTLLVNPNPSSDELLENDMVELSLLAIESSE